MHDHLTIDEFRLLLLADLILKPATAILLRLQNVLKLPHILREPRRSKHLLNERHQVDCSRVALTWASLLSSLPRPMLQAVLGALPRLASNHSIVVFSPSSK